MKYIRILLLQIITLVLMCSCPTEPYRKGRTDEGRQGKDSYDYEQEKEEETSGSKNELKKGERKRTQ